MSSVTLDVSHAQELIEFWSTRCKEVEHELEQTKRLLGITPSERKSRWHPQSLQTDKLDELIKLARKESARRQLAEAELRKLVERQHDGARHGRTAQLEEENEALTRRLRESEQQRAILMKQLSVFRAQGDALAIETSAWRANRISDMFRDPPYVPPTFQPSPISTDNPDTLVKALPSQFLHGHSLYFLPRPPSCLPLRLSGVAKSGYWFHPTRLLSDKTVFELIVECKENEWTYLGSYCTAPLPGFEMSLAEWMAIDEEAKATHCSRVRGQILSRSHLPESFAAGLNVRRYYDTGEWSVPCYSLRCVGFNMALYDALHEAMQTARSCEDNLLQTRQRPLTPISLFPERPAGYNARTYQPSELERTNSTFSTSTAISDFDFSDRSSME
ncbi:hypothetical protein WOLCODRAFT_161725 [Wolfiporia cocos MD-104 SS10]|uniref:DUF6697 domain-containing protein n=1 Tax=Wolfiporia cocos (strain MD-104) TaxID=742152 RepID=A0A2H3J9P6_WOLCO|nr:hypothetical protein WOLCODRAFT_161725 [Wolfiporia cocos MD-104 SS10]